MKLLAPIAAFIAAASAGQIYTGQSAEGYAQSAENYQSALEYQQHGLYSEQSQAPQAFTGHTGHDHEESYNSRPAGEKTARILAFNNENNGHQYQYSFETENGIRTEEAGQTSEHGTVTQGAYSYKGDDGQTYTVTYTADENGFHPQGAHLPTPPPIPEAIAKSLEQNAKDEAAGIFDDGKYKEQSGQNLAHGYQQYDSSYQNSYQAPSGHSSGAGLAYQAPSGHASGADLAYRAHSANALSGISGHSTGGQSASSGHGASSQLAYHAPSGHGVSSQLAYHTPSGHSSGTQSAYQSSSGYDNAQLAYHAPSGYTASSPQPFHVSSGHSAAALQSFLPNSHSTQVAYHVPTSHTSASQAVFNIHSGYAHSGHALGPELVYRG